MTDLSDHNHPTDFTPQTQALGREAANQTHAAQLNRNLLKDLVPAPGLDPFHISPEEMAQKLRPLRAVNSLGGPKVALKEGMITAARVSDGLNKLITRLNEVRGMSDVVRESLTREVPKDPVEDASSPQALEGPIFEQLARLTLVLSAEIERVEKNMALSLAVLK